MHPPPKPLRNALSAPVVALASGSSKLFTTRCNSESSSRICTASAPWPGAGGNSRTPSFSLIRSSSPSRNRPAVASTTASYIPSSTLRIRVSTLPLISTTSRSGRWNINNAARRGLPVPIRAPWPKDIKDAPEELTNESLESCRRGTAATITPALSSTGKSFRECTATSIRPSAKAASSSEVKCPMPGRLPRS